MASVSRDDTRVVCEDCGEQVTEWARTDDGYDVCECCWDHRARQGGDEADAGEQQDDFAAEEAWEDDEGEEVVIVGSATWWASGIQDSKDAGAYGLLTRGGDEW